MSSGWRPATHSAARPAVRPSSPSLGLTSIRASGYGAAHRPSWRPAKCRRDSPEPPAESGSSCCESRSLRPPRPARAPPDREAPDETRVRKASEPANRTTSSTRSSISCQDSSGCGRFCGSCDESKLIVFNITSRAEFGCAGYGGAVSPRPLRGSNLLPSPLVGEGLDFGELRRTG